MKKILSHFAFLLAGIFAAVVSLLIYGLFFTQSAVIQDVDKQYYYADRLIIFGNAAAGFISSSSPQNRDLENLPRTFTVMDMETIATINVNPFTTVHVPPQYLGTYRINASGHEGILVLRMKDGMLYGSVRFPNWANGVWEALKGVSIKNNNLYFTRSVTTERERIKTGAREYFTQRYVGSYKDNGRRIIGFYKLRGAKYLFEAHRKK